MAVFAKTQIEHSGNRAYYEIIGRSKHYLWQVIFFPPPVVPFPPSVSRFKAPEKETNGRRFFNF